MTHGYSLRSNAKGRRGHQSTDDPDGQVEGPRYNASASTCSTSKGHDKSGAAAEGSATPHPPRAAAHNTRVPAQHSEHNIMSSSTTTPHHHTDKPGGPATTRYHRVRLEGNNNNPLETWDEIQAGRKREEVRRLAEAVRIRREQVVRGFEEEMRALRARIGALREECEVRVARVRREWERRRGRGEVVVVDSDSDSDLDPDPDEGSEMEVENNYAPTETSLTTDNTDDDEQWQQQWPSRSRSAPRWSRFETSSPPPPLSQRQQQQSHVGIGIPLSSGVGPSWLEPEAMEEENEDAHRQPWRQSQGRRQPQPLRRQPAQLMAIPISSVSLHAYATAALVPENRFGGTDVDKDSEMGE
jgi:hypothetical protein